MCPIHQRISCLLAIVCTLCVCQSASAKQFLRGWRTSPVERIAANDTLRSLEQRDNKNAKQIGTNLRSFGIPFSVADPDSRYIEVQLYVSRDRGQSWNFHSRQPTTAREFLFDSNGEGEYWFAIRTLDRDRKVHPAGSMVPELKVMVDTIQPQLDFRIQTDAAGRIVCRWRADDENIDPSTTRLAFRPLVSTDDSANNWHSVPYKPVAGVVDGVFTDQYAWWPEPRSLEVLVQLAISDTAGNTATEERQLALPRTGPAAGQQKMATGGTDGVKSGLFEVSSTTRSPGPNEVNAARPAFETAPVDPNPPQAQMYGVAKPPTQPLDPNQAVTSAPSSIPWSSQAINGSGQLPVVANNRPVYPDQRPLLTGDDGTSKVESPPKADVGSTALQSIPPPVAPNLSSPNQPDGMQSVQQPSRPLPDSATAFQNASAPTPIGNPPQISNDSVLGRSHDIRYMNSRRFRLDYSMDAIVPGTIAKVVLWMTTDAGKTWTAWGEDTDNESPFAVEVAEQGLYGFRVVFHTTDGLAGRSPQRDDDADVWIAVDLDFPDARLTGAPYGQGQNAGRLMIVWQAQDALLRNRPVRLSYSSERAGPWTLIEDGLDNTGEFAWKPDSKVPDRVYIRLDVTDAAGNIGTSATDQPIDLTGLIPRGRIIDVMPVR